MDMANVQFSVSILLNSSSPNQHMIDELYVLDTKLTYFA